MAQAADALLESGPVKQSRPRHDQHPESGIRADDADARTTWGTTTALTRMCSDYHRCRPANYRRNRHFIMTLLVRGIDWSNPTAPRIRCVDDTTSGYDLLHSRLGAAILRRRDEGPPLPRLARSHRRRSRTLAVRPRGDGHRRTPMRPMPKSVRGSPRFIRHTSAARYIHPNVRTYLAQPQWLYVDVFAGGQMKVGTASEFRKHPASRRTRGSLRIVR